MEQSFVLAWKAMKIGNLGNFFQFFIRSP